MLYVDNILLASNDNEQLHGTKHVLSKTFDMNDFGDVSFVFGIAIHRDWFKGLFGILQRSYIDCVLSKLNMQNYRIRDAYIVESDKLNLSQYPKNDLKRINEEYIIFSCN